MLRVEVQHVSVGSRDREPDDVVSSLIAQRTVIYDMLSCWWGEVGWQLPRATTREELRAALALAMLVDVSKDS